jgi:hypothetical protein
MDDPMSDSKSGVQLSDLASLLPEAYQKGQESLWKSYGSKENWEEVKAMMKQIGRLEKQNAAQHERIEELELENKALLQGWTERKKDDVN